MLALLGGEVAFVCANAYSASRFESTIYLRLSQTMLLIRGSISMLHGVLIYLITTLYCDGLHC